MAFTANVELARELESCFMNREAVGRLGEKYCREIFESYIVACSTTPKYTTVRVNTLTTTKQDVLNHLKKELPKFEVYGHDIISDLVIIVSRLIVPTVVATSKEVVVGVKCAESVLRGADVYAPGVIGAPVELKAGDHVSVYADLEGRCLRGAVKPCAGEKHFVGNGIAQCSRHDLFVANKLSGTAVRMTEPIIRNPSLDYFQKEGAFFLQNLPSVVCGHVLEPLPGQNVLDMCAAPGGKTTHLAALMCNQGVLIALDKTKPKVAKIMNNISVLKSTCVHAFHYDATKCCDPLAPPRIADLGEPPFPREMFDRVLLDAPCSALGQRPQLRNSMTVKELRSYPKYQRKLLKIAIELLKPGGILVYSTCTVTIEENEMQVKWVLDNYPSMRLDQQEPRLGQAGYPGAGLTDENLALLQRFGMTTDIEEGSNRDTIGFFIAKFVKVIS